LRPEARSELFDAPCSYSRQDLSRARTSHKALDFSPEESVHADVLGGRWHSANGRVRLALMAGLWVVGVPRMGAGAQMEDHPMAGSHPIDETRSEAAVERTKRRLSGWGGKEKARPENLRPTGRHDSPNFAFCGRLYGLWPG
jgi:hypothetical protein